MAACAERTLGIFAKRPAAGQVKTRLAAETAPAWAAQVAEAFLADLLDRLGDYPARRVLAYAPATERAYFEEVGRGRFMLSPQGDGDLGQRMERFFRKQIEGGTRRVVLLGSDSPTLPVAFIDAAFDGLARADLALGPAADGGYYLIGCANEVPPVFDGIHWGQATVLAETVARVTEPRWRLQVLPVWSDVDTLSDWHALRGYIAALRRAGVDPQVPRTEALSAWRRP